MSTRKDLAVSVYEMIVSLIVLVDVLKRRPLSFCCASRINLLVIVEVFIHFFNLLYREAINKLIYKFLGA